LHTIFSTKNVKNLGRPDAGGQTENAAIFLSEGNLLIEINDLLSCAGACQQFYPQKLFASRVAGPRPDEIAGVLSARSGQLSGLSRSCPVFAHRQFSLMNQYA
jgi:hypothetical protein